MFGRYGKSQLPGWSFIIVGIIIIAYSKFIESKVKANLLLFVIAGALFILYGAYKEFILRLKVKPAVKETVGPPRPNTPEHHSTHLHPAGNVQHGVSPHVSHPHVQQSQFQSHPYSAQHKRCPRCHSINAGQARFCHNCGYQFF